MTRHAEIAAIPSQAQPFSERLTNFFIALLFAIAVIGMAALIGHPHGRGWVMIDAFLLCTFGFSLGHTARAARLMHLPKSWIPTLLAGFGALGCTSVILVQLFGGYTNTFTLGFTLLISAMIPFQIVLRTLFIKAKARIANQTSS
jgi:hypothetical protein